MNDCITKSKFENAYGCRRSLHGGIIRAADVMVGGMSALACGYGHVGMGCAFAMRGAGVRIMITEIDPICTLQACVEGFQVVTCKTSGIFHCACWHGLERHCHEARVVIRV